MLKDFRILKMTLKRVLSFYDDGSHLEYALLTETQSLSTVVHCLLTNINDHPSCISNRNHYHRIGESPFDLHPCQLLDCIAGKTVLA